MPSPSPPVQVRVKIAATSVNLSDWECLRGSPAYARVGELRFPLAGRSVRHRRPDRRCRGKGDPVPTRRRGVGDDLRLKGGFAENTLAPIRTRPQARPARLRRGVDHPAGGRDRPAGHGEGRDGSPGVDQRRWRRVGILRDSAREAAGCSRHRCRQRLQAGLHAVGRRGSRDRLSPDDCPRTSQLYDLILDLAAHRSVFAYRRALAPGGTYRCVGGRCPRCCACLPVGRLVGRLAGRAIKILAVEEGPAHFEPLAALCATRDVRIHIHRTFALDEVPDALAEVGERRDPEKW